MTQPFEPIEIVFEDLPEEDAVFLARLAEKYGDGLEALIFHEMWLYHAPEMFYDKDDRSPEALAAMRQSLLILWSRAQHLRQALGLPQPDAEVSAGMPPVLDNLPEPKLPARLSRPPLDHGSPDSLQVQQSVVFLETHACAIRQMLYSWGVETATGLPSASASLPKLSHETADKTGSRAIEWDID